MPQNNQFKIVQVSQNEGRDAAELFDQYRQFYTMPGDLNAAKNFISKRLNQQDSLLLIAYKETQAIGLMQVYFSFSSVAMQPIWILNDLFIKPPARRLGCASQMFDYLHQKAKQNEIFAIKLATEVNNKKAKALYLSLGYQLIDNFDNFSFLVS